MRRHMVLAASLLLSGCSGFLHFLSDTSSPQVRLNAPLGGSETMERARGRAVDVPPLLPQPGDVWPGPPKAQPTLSDLQKLETPTIAPDAPRAARRAATPVPAQTPPGTSEPGHRIVIPNGNGTSTVIAPDGTVSTIKTPQ